MEITARNLDTYHTITETPDAVAVPTRDNVDEFPYLGHTAAGNAYHLVDLNTLMVRPGYTHTDEAPMSGKAQCRRDIDIAHVWRQPVESLAAGEMCKWCHTVIRSDVTNNWGSSPAQDEVEWVNQSEGPQWFPFEKGTSK